MIAPDGTSAYVINSGSDNVSVIEIATNTITGTIGVGDFPLDADITPDGTLAYVTNRDSDGVSVIDIATNMVITTVGVGDEPRDLAITPDGSRAYVINNNSDDVSVIDLATNMVITTLGVGDGPVRVARGDVAAACASLQDFINHVNAQEGKKLTAGQAAQYRTAATAVRTALGCP